MTDEKEIKSSLLEELGLGGLSEEKQDELLAKMIEVVMKRILIETIEKLDEKSRDEYARMVETQAAPEELEKFLKEKIPDYDAMVKKIVDDFKEEMKK
ncbi:MAG: DUF5663 domain-containing protein [Parcubacteria group bacterium]|jgi:hypothetical protein